MSLGRRGFIPCQNPKTTSYHDYRHGIKPTAYHWSREPHGHKNDRVSHDYWEWGWERVYKISKSWKDQSKRRHQYRPIEM